VKSKVISDATTEAVQAGRIAKLGGEFFYLWRVC
jgi:hypothetical protein